MEENNIKYTIKVCTGYKCKRKESGLLFNAFKEALGIADGERISKALSAELAIMDCAYNCGDGPIVMINDMMHTEVTAEDVKRFAEEIRVGASNF